MSIAPRWRTAGELTKGKGMSEPRYEPTAEEIRAGAAREREKWDARMEMIRRGIDPNGSVETRLMRDPGMQLIGGSR